MVQVLMKQLDKLKWKNHMFSTCMQLLFSLVNNEFRLYLTCLPMD